MLMHSTHKQAGCSFTSLYGQVEIKAAIVLQALDLNGLLSPELYINIFCMPCIVSELNYLGNRRNADLDYLGLMLYP